jgi:hypothetical protein
MLKSGRMAAACALSFGAYSVQPEQMLLKILMLTAPNYLHLYAVAQLHKNNYFLN